MVINVWNIIFENKKVLRQHISKRHMILQLSKSDDDNALNAIENTGHLLKRKKVGNENNATTRREL